MSPKEESRQQILQAALLAFAENGYDKTSMDDIVQVIEENDIDSGAYFYTEIEGSYTGEKYLRQSLEMGAPDEFGLTLPFISGIVSCLVLLCVGFRYLPE